MPRDRANPILPFLAVLSLPLLMGAPGGRDAPAHRRSAPSRSVGPLRIPTLGAPLSIRRSAHAPRRSSVPALAPCDDPIPEPGAYRPPFGERLRYDLEVMGVRAGTLELAWRPDGPDAARIEVKARTNTFFENVRRLRASATSYLSSRTLRPTRYREDAVEDAVQKWAEVHFRPARHEVEIHYAYGKHEIHRRYGMSTGPHDILSAVTYLRTLPLAVGQTFCLDVYGNRRVWRVRGSVQSEEWVSTPVGRIKTFRLSGVARRVDAPRTKKEIHLWIGQDEAHTPVAVLSEIDLGPISATLSGVRRPGTGGSRKADYGGGTW